MTRYDRPDIPAHSVRIRRLFLAVLLVSCAALRPPAVWSQDTGGQNPAVLELDTAQVIIDGEILFHVVGITSFPPEARARRIQGEIKAAASDRSFDSNDIAVVTASDGSLEIRAGDRRIMTLLAEDAAVEGLALDAFSNVVREKIGIAVDSYRFQRTRGRIIRSSLFAAAAILLAFLTVLLLNWAFRKLKGLVQRRIRSMVDAVEQKSFRLVRSARILQVINAFLSLIRIVLIVIVLLFCVEYCLSLFPWTRNISRAVLEAVLRPLRAFFRHILALLPKLAVLTFIVIVTRYVLRLLRLFFNGIQDGSIRLKSLEPDTALPTYNIVRLLLLLVAAVIAYPYIPGSESPAFKALSVFVGVLFSLGSSSIVGNVIAGYSMTYRKAFRPGDRIMVDGQVGFVLEQKTTVTRIRTAKNEEVIMPNSVLVNSSIVNYSTKAKESGVILHTSVGVGYETPWRLVDAMLLTAADRTGGLLKNPPPFVLKKSLGEFAVEYEINGYCDNPLKIAQIYSELHGNILDIFNENEIQIMRPAYEGDPEAPKVVAREDWYRPLRADETEGPNKDGTPVPDTEPM